MAEAGENLVIIRTLSELEALKEYLKDKEYVSFDTETTGVEKESQVIGFSVSCEVDTGFYVILSYWDVESQRLVDLETKDGSKSFMEGLVGKSLIMHNALFDCWMVRNNFQVDLMPSVHTDTMLLAHITDENRHCGLKELGMVFFGEDASLEQRLMKESVHKNGGVLTKDKYELYKADADLMAKYGAKDAILTLNVFYVLVEDLFNQGLDKFFYEDESMPLLRGPTYDLNTTGLRVDPDKLQTLKGTLEAECLEAKAYIHKEIEPYVKEKFPGTRKTNVFNIGASKQLAWLLFIQLGNEFHVLTKEGKELCKALNLKLPYTMGAKREFIRVVEENNGRIWQESKFNPKTKKMSRPKKVGDPWNYLACGRDTLSRLSGRYKWVSTLLEYAKNLKLLNTYVEGIQSRMKYNVIRPQFLQHGTTSGRYSSKNPNFQNLPRDDKRIKACIVARPGKVFVGADYSQLEPRVFASFSQDVRLMNCFESGDDFYSVVGAEVFGKNDCTLKKDDSPDSFPVKYKKLRDVAKVIALAAPYGTTAPQMSGEIEKKAGQIKTIDECQAIIDDYFANYPQVEQLMLSQHEKVKKEGEVQNLFGRKRRIPGALTITQIYGSTPHARLPREVRTLLNMAMNHPIQSTGASIMNRAAIACWRRCRDLEAQDKGWSEVKIVLQVHDELILEGPEHLSQQMLNVLKNAMESTVLLPGVSLIAEPKIAKNLADLK